MRTRQKQENIKHTCSCYGGKRKAYRRSAPVTIAWTSKKTTTKSMLHRENHPHTLSPFKTQILEEGANIQRSETHSRIRNSKTISSSPQTCYLEILSKGLIPSFHKKDPKSKGQMSKCNILLRVMKLFLVSKGK